MEARILSRKIVKPAFPTPDHLRVRELSIFDQLAPPAHVPLVFFYKNFPVQGKLEQLVKSLSQTLTRFYPLAGRFVREGFYVDCNDEGVEYIEAELDNIEISDFLNLAEKNIELVNDLVPWNDIGDTFSVTTPIMGIKVTMFKCGGLALGTLVSHIVADGFTADKFVNDWSTTTSTLLGTIHHEVIPAFKPAIFAVPSYFPTTDWSLPDIKNMAMPLSKIKESKIVTRRFVFNEKSISTLKAKVVERANVTRPTRVEVVTSIIWKALINLSSSDQSKRRNSTLYLHLNLRGRTGITETQLASSCGNFYLEVPTRFIAENSGLELHELVSLLRNSLRSTLKNCSNISSNEGLLSEVAKHASGVRNDKENEDVDVWLLSTLCRFPFYEVDFGWGKPEWVTTGGIPAEVMFLLDTKCGTGIEAVLNLHEIDMLQFEQDQDIIAFTS